MRALTIALAGLYAAGGAAAYVVLAALGKDTASFILFYAGILTTSLPSVLTLFKVHSTAQAVSEVKDIVDSETAAKPPERL
jgi:hypothetical protein